jgi:hypothetical protein
MSLHEKVVKELGYGMNMPNETDIAFMALWVSRRVDGSLNSTACNIEEEPLTDELRERIATVLRNLANMVSAQQGVEPTVYHSGDQPAEDNQSEGDLPA